MAISNTLTALRVEGTSAIQGGYVPFQVLGLNNTITLTPSNAGVVSGIENSSFNRYVKIAAVSPIPNPAQFGNSIKLDPETLEQDPVSLKNLTKKKSYNIDDYVIYRGTVVATGLSHWIIGQVTGKSGNTWTVNLLFRELETLIVPAPLTGNQYETTGNNDPLKDFSNSSSVGIGTSLDWTPSSGVRVNGWTYRTNSLNRKIQNDLAPLMGTLMNF